MRAAKFLSRFISQMREQLGRADEVREQKRDDAQVSPRSPCLLPVWIVVAAEVYPQAAGRNPFDALFCDLNKPLLADVTRPYLNRLPLLQELLGNKTS